MDIEFIVLSYLGCDSGRYPSSLDSSALFVFTRSLPALVVCLAGAVETGRSPEEEKGRRGLPKANIIVVPS